MLVRDANRDDMFSGRPCFMKTLAITLPWELYLPTLVQCVAVPRQTISSIGFSSLIELGPMIEMYLIASY